MNKKQTSRVYNTDQGSDITSLSFWGERLAVSLAAIFISPILTWRIGGVRVLIAGALFGFLLVLIDPVRRKGILGLQIRQNRFLLFLFIWFCLGTIVANYRYWSFTYHEFTTLGLSVLCLFLGLYVAAKPALHRFMIYALIVPTAVQTQYGLDFISTTQTDIRMALGEFQGALGHTGHWTNMVFFTFLLLGMFVTEKRKIVKIILLPFLANNYRMVLFCGFATPVALLIAGHGFLGGILFLYRDKGFLKFIKIVPLGIIALAFSYYLFTWLASTGDTRFLNIQWRFQNLIENPMGGGYELENSRFKLMEISWESFKEKPYFGHGGPYRRNQSAGGHQSFADFLAMYGLLGGGGSFIMLTFHFINNTRKRSKFEPNFVNYALFVNACIFFVGGIFNPIWFSNVFYFLLGFSAPVMNLNPQRMHYKSYQTDHNPMSNVYDRQTLLGS